MAWFCGLEKSYYKVNSRSVQLIQAMPATVDWEEVYGSIRVWSGGIHIIRVYYRHKLFCIISEPAPKITCIAEHSRPAGRFLWFIGEVRNI